MRLDLDQLRLAATTGSIGFRLPLQQLDLGPELGQRTELASQLVELSAGGAELHRLLLQPCGPLSRRGALMLRHADLGFELQRGFPQLLKVLPSGTDFSETLFSHFAGPRCERFNLPCLGQPLIGTLLGLFELGQIGKPCPQRVDAGAERGALLSQPVLGSPQTLVAEHAREKLSSLRRTHGGHDREVLLTGEVRIEELLPGHAQETGDPLGDCPNTEGDRGGVSILIQLSLVERTNDSILVSAEGEIDFHFHPCARRSAAAPKGFAIAPRGGHPVHRPRNRFQDGGLARAVGTNNSGQTGAEFDLSELVLPKVDQSNAVELHQPPDQSRSTESISSRPSRMNASRSSSAGSGRAAR